MRALSARQAAQCETAQHARCRCRCGGARHGAKRSSARGTRPALDDPHAAAFYDPAEIRAATRRLRDRDPRQLEIA